MTASTKSPCFDSPSSGGNQQGMHYAPGSRRISDGSVSGRSGSVPNSRGCRRSALKLVPACMIAEGGKLGPAVSLKTMRLPWLVQLFLNPLPVSLDLLLASVTFPEVSCLPASFTLSFFPAPEGTSYRKPFHPRATDVCRGSGGHRPAPVHQNRFEPPAMVRNRHSRLRR
jgi:hypothetical protein